MGSDLKVESPAANPGIGAQNSTNSHKAVTSQAIPHFACIAGLPRNQTPTFVNLIYSVTARMSS
jgi:hypothetical protein